jgi:hypothetical protein
MNSTHKNQCEVIINHFSGAAQCEIRGDEPARSGKLTFAALDAPHNPCCSAESTLLPRNPCPTLLNRSEWFESPKRMVPTSVKEESPVSVTSDSNDAVPPAIVCSDPDTPSGLTCEVSVQLGAEVEALITPDAPAFGPALPLNYIA